MKKIYLLVVFGALAVTMQAQDRIYWSASCPTFARMASDAGVRAAASSTVTNPSATTAGWFQGMGDPTTGSVTPAINAHNSVGIKPEHSIAISPSGFLYGIAGNFNQSTNNGVIQLAYKSAISLDNTAPLTTVAFDVNGAGVNRSIIPYAMGISVTGNGGLIYEDAAQYRYIGFTANANGSVTWGTAVTLSFTNNDNPTAWDNFPTVVDLVYDSAGDLYILAMRANPDYTVIQHVIYSVSAAGLVSGAITAEIKWTVADTKTLSMGEVTGLGYASGNFYISQSDTEDMITFTSYITAVQPPATGTSIVLGSDYTAFSGYCPITDLAVIPASVLPVNWGSVSANIRNDRLEVQWQTLTETNNDYFEIEASVDGVIFSSIGKVDSKAINGNNDTILNYDFSTAANGVALGFSAVALLMVFIRRRKTFFALAAALAVTAIVQVGCSKNSNEAVAADASLFVRIAQVDKDGTKTYSKVILVKK